MKEISCIIVEDEERSINVLRKMIQEYIPNVEIVGLASSVAEGVALIQKSAVDLVFLDIRLGDGSGFDLIHQLPEVNFNIVFTTAYEEYAIQAVRCSALDYLLKPIDIDELTNAVERVLLNSSEKANSAALKNYAREVVQDGEASNIGLPSGRGIEFIEKEEIIRCEAGGSYSTVFCLNKTKIVVSRNLKEMEALLNDPMFIRCHRSHLINRKYIKEYQRGNGGIVHMHDGSHVEVSKRMKPIFLKRIKAG